MKREYPPTPEEAFMNTVKWAYYEKEIKYLVENNRICKLSYDPRLSVDVAWDIWWAWWWDDTSLRFIQRFWKEKRVIDYWEGTWYSMIDIINDVIAKKWYKYNAQYLPRDAQIHEQTTMV